MNAVTARRIMRKWFFIYAAMCGIAAMFGDSPKDQMAMLSCIACLLVARELKP